MAVRFVTVTGAFNGITGVVLRTQPAEASDSVLVGFSFKNDLAAGEANDRTVLIVHQVTGPIASGAYEEVVPGGQANKAFTPGCLGTSTAGHQFIATLNGAGAFRWVAVFRETYT